jgi:bifunctional non-homologous end joining protein LigD
VGYFDSGSLRYAGKVGTGFGRATLAELGAQLRKLETDDSPFAEVRPIPRGTHWVSPELVAQIGFTEWTRDGRLRHPRYIGLRDDKPAGDVVREVPS